MLISVKVRPNSKETVLEEVDFGVYVARIKEPPENGKANLALIKLLAKEFSVNQKSVKIKNPTSKKKIVEIVL